MIHIIVYTLQSTGDDQNRQYLYYIIIIVTIIYDGYTESKTIPMCVPTFTALRFLKRRAIRYNNINNNNNNNNDVCPLFE